MYFSIIPPSLLFSNRDSELRINLIKSPFQKIDLSSLEREPLIGESCFLTNFFIKKWTIVGCKVAVFRQQRLVRTNVTKESFIIQIRSQSKSKNPPLSQRKNLLSLDPKNVKICNVIIHSLHEKCPNTEFFLPRISCIHSKHRKIRARKNSVFRHFSHSDCGRIFLVSFRPFRILIHTIYCQYKTNQANAVQD